MQPLTEKQRKVLEFLEGRLTEGRPSSQRQIAAHFGLAQNAVFQLIRYLKQKGYLIDIGGHRGLRSITERLGTKDYPRLRLGIGAPPGDMDARDYVLSPFTQPELEEAQAMVERARQAIECALTDGFEAAMNEFN